MTRSEKGDKRIRERGEESAQRLDISLMPLPVQYNVNVHAAVRFEDHCLIALDEKVLLDKTFDT